MCAKNGLDVTLDYLVEYSFAVSYYPPGQTRYKTQV